MATTPRRSRISPPSTPQTPPSLKRRIDGLWYSGRWWCNCEPRQEAILRPVIKETRNKGKLFWACKTYPYCGFFLWRDAASVRERLWTTDPDIEAEGEELPPPSSLVPRLTQRLLTSCGIQVTPGRRRSRDQAAAADHSESNAEDEPAPAGTQAPAETQAPPRPAVMETPDAGSSKRKRDVFDDVSDQYSDWGSDEERQLADITDRSAEKLRGQNGYVESSPSTVRGTPTLSRAAEIIGGLADKPVSRTLFPTAEGKRQKAVSFEEPNSSAELPTPAKTPAANRNQVTPSSSPNDANEDITDEVMGLLQNQGVDNDVLESVHKALVTSARKAKGFALGRESARAAIKDKDEKASKLQQRIVTLENKNKMLNTQLTNMKADLIKMYEAN